MAWICDNETDEAVIECQIEIRRLRGVVRELQDSARANQTKKRALWKDHKVIGYADLSDKQVEELNSIKETGVYVGFDETTNPKAYR